MHETRELRCASGAPKRSAAAPLLDLPVILPYVESKRLKAIAVSSPRRVPSVPNVPTIAEAGFPDVSGYNWYGFALPAATPKEIVGKLNTALLSVVDAPDIKLVDTSG